jgi:hypothetical protein
MSASDRPEMASGAWGTPPVAVHIKRKNGAVVAGCDIYIGRAMYRGGWQLPKSAWANPFVLHKDGKNRAQVLADYEAYVRRTPELMAALPSLGGQRLGCWCKPLPCHGDVLARLYAEHIEVSPCEVGAGAPAPEDEVLPALQIPDDDPVWGELGL